MANFAMIGAAGFIAPRHLEAIKALGHRLVAAIDVNDSVGVIDRYHPDARFFTDFERFESFLDEQRGTADQVEYVSICSPNYLHSAHIKSAFRMGAHAICEKPLVLNMVELDELARAQIKYDRRVFTVLQLRAHDAILALRKRVNEARRASHRVELTYMTSRGQWYLESWKGRAEKSGGLSSNIGVHFFDMLTWIFGDVRSVKLFERSPTRESGELELARASVKWTLSIDRRDLPTAATTKGLTTFRSLRIDGEEFEFSEGFTELHQRVYREILEGRGFGVEDARAAIGIVEQIRGLSL
jgi:UDP-N-acetyl-2-amino-2-deoxyglucuronate dehydrogenase